MFGFTRVTFRLQCSIVDCIMYLFHNRWIFQLSCDRTDGCKLSTSDPDGPGSWEALILDVPNVVRR